MKTSKILTSVLLAASGFLISTAPVLAQTTSWENTPGCVINGVATIGGVGCLLGNILSVAITIIGLGGFIMMLVGSFKYLISGGNAKGTETARSTITFAIIGLVLALSAYFILNILADFTGISVITQFKIPDVGVQSP